MEWGEDDVGVCSDSYSRNCFGVGLRFLRWIAFATLSVRVMLLNTSVGEVCSKW